MSQAQPFVLSSELMAELVAFAAVHGVPRLSPVSLDHPGFETARTELERFLECGLQGEMDYLARTVEVRKDPSAMLPGARCVLMAAVPYRGEAGPVARYAQAADYHSVLHRRLEPVAEVLRQRLPGVQTLVCVDTKPIMERAGAALAGLGFIGKHGCVIVPGLGSYVLLGAILCTAQLQRTDAQREAEVERPRKALWDACGSCRRCLDACPTDAFEAPGALDPRRCISYLTIEHRGPIPDALADAMGERIAGCDVCQEVCPYNATGHRDSTELSDAWLDPAPPTSLSASLEELANIGSAVYRRFVKETALRRIPRRAMLRNALLAIGNREGPMSEAERAAVEAAAADAEPLVRAAAERAQKRR